MKVEVPLVPLPLQREAIEGLVAALIEYLDCLDAPLEDLEPEEDRGAFGEEEPEFWGGVRADGLGASTLIGSDLDTLV